MMGEDYWSIVCYFFIATNFFHVSDQTRRKNLPMTVLGSNTYFGSTPFPFSFIKKLMNSPYFILEGVPHTLFFFLVAVFRN